MKFNEKRKDKNKRLAKNTFFLYIMTISTYVLNLLTVPYLTRVLGPSTYGEVGLAIGYMSYVQIILDFGFILSATQMISEHRLDSDFSSRIIASVTIIKIILAILILIIFFFFYKIRFFSENLTYMLAIYLLAYLCSALLPDFFYRGIENMKAISFRTVFIKVIFTVLVFVLVKDRKDVIFVPISALLGNLVALFFTYYDLKTHYNLKLQMPSAKELWRLMVVSVPFFISRLASTFYQALNVIILGKTYGTSPIVGYYTSSDKLIALAKTASSPIADSLYPYMLENKNYKLVKKLLIIIMPIITMGVIFVGIYAKPICSLLFGTQYKEAGNILRLLLPIAWIVLPNYIVAFPIMSPLGLIKYTNISNIIGMIIQIGGLIILWLIGKFNIYYICILTTITEISVFIYRLSMVLIYHIKMKRREV